MTDARRSRGRPRAGDASDTRAAIVAAARAQFAAKGFDGASLRAIALEAGVDASLISHYFGDKSRLLVDTLQLPVNPIDRLKPVLAGDIDEMGPRLVTAFVSAWDPHHDVFSALIRTALGSGDPSATPVLQVVRNIVVSSLRERMNGADAELRATLMAAQLIGMATLRYVVRLEPVSSAAPEKLARWYGPAVQQLLTPPPG